MAYRIESDLILRRGLRVGVERSPYGEAHWASAEVLAPSLLACGNVRVVMGGGKSMYACNRPEGSVQLPPTQHSCAMDRSLSKATWAFVT